MTVSNNDSSINIWSTQAGLTRVWAFNFKIQIQIDPKKSIEKAKLHFLKYSKQELENEVVIFSSKNRKPKAKEVLIEPPKDVEMD
ncbi:MAG: hypothetical protein ACI8WP_001693 [Flavobacteriaceae bacterium]|jgi:hypothetical protein